MSGEMVRIPVNYNSLTDLVYICSDDLVAIEINAKVLEFDEVLDHLLIDQADLTQRELTLCKKAHRRGRLEGLVQAGQNLFSQMKARNGTVACLEYLKQHSSSFQMEVSPSPGSASGFAFNVIMPEDSGD